MSAVPIVEAFVRFGTMAGMRDLVAGKAVFAGTPGEHVYNPIGAVHGRYAATLLDSACGCAVHPRLTASQVYATLELKVAYHKAITKDTGLLRAEGRLLSFGQRVALTCGWSNSPTPTNNRAFTLLGLRSVLLLMYFPEPADIKALWSVDYIRVH
jgi:uncharacterized protein (TIGR00369 family)